MPVLGRALGLTLRGAAATIRGARATARGGQAAGGWVTRRVNSARTTGGAGEIGMIRLLDLHAASCAGDTLITMGLAGTVFFSVSAGEARGRVALYLLVTMAPFALLAPVIGPLLDRFRHGRRYALAVTMLGRAFLAWLISDYIHAFGLYPAALGVLVMSRAYGVARSAAVPRLLPERLLLSQVGARASVFGTVAGAVVAPIGLLAFYFGPQWPLRVASVIFLVGTVIALRLPGRADSDPAETVPRPFGRASGRTGAGVLSNRSVIATVGSAAALRALFGYLTLYLAFAIRSGELTTRLFAWSLPGPTAIGLAAVALGLGAFLATAAGTRLRIHRPTLLQAIGLVLLAGVGLIATVGYNLATVVLLCLVVAGASGLAKIAADATISERVPEHIRASAFAHSETLLMLAWVAGGGLGLIPFGGRLGIGIAAAGACLAAVRAVALAVRLRRERLLGVASGEVPRVPEATTVAVPAAAAQPSGRPRWRRTRSSGGSARPARVPAARGTGPDPNRTGGPGPGGGDSVTGNAGAGPSGGDNSGGGNSGSDNSGGGDSGGGASGGGASGDGNSRGGVERTRTLPRADQDAPTFHLYRPSATPPAPTPDDE